MEEQDEHKRKVDTLWRGVYGDEQNDVPGLIHDVSSFKKLEKKLTKLVYVGMGAIGTLTVLLEIIKQFF